METEPSKKSKKYKCLNKGCNKHFSSMQSRSNHVNKNRCKVVHLRSPKRAKKSTIGKESIPNYKCKFCKKAFQQHQSVYRHHRVCDAARINDNKEPIPKKVKGSSDFNCSICPMKFDRADKLERHMKKHTGENEKKCVKCERVFRRVDFYNKHVKICDGTKKHAIGSSKFQCESCSKSFTKIETFDIHVATCQVSESSVNITNYMEESSPSFLQQNSSPSFLQQPSPSFLQQNSFPSFLQQPSPSFLRHHSSPLFIQPGLPVECGNNYVADDGVNEDLGVTIMDESDVELEENNDVTDNLEGTIIDDRMLEQNSSTLMDSTLEKDTEERNNHSINEDDSICVVLPSDYANQTYASKTDDSMQDSFAELGNSENFEEINDECDYKDLLCDGFLREMKKNRHRSNKIFPELYSIFGVKLVHDKHLSKWVAKSLGMRTTRFRERLRKWLNGELSGRGRPRVTAAKAQAIFDAWIAHSTISVDRRDGRDMVRIPMTEYQDRYKGIETSLVKPYTNKRNTLMAEAPRYMSHKTVREMEKLIEQQEGKFSLGTIYKFRPYFVVAPSEREKLECLCTVCCNARSMFNAIQRSAKKNGFKQYTSITSYLTHGKTCKLATSGYISKECIVGDCEECNGLICPAAYYFTQDDLATYYQFELHPTGKLDKNNKPKKKTKRVDYNSVPVSSVVLKLENFAERYLLHRYDVRHDKFIWPIIQEKCDKKGEFIVHMDYSENLKEKPKFETQPHHFSGEQHSLHCSVAETPDGNYYFYHFSDEKTHDWRYTKAVILALLKEIYGDQVIIRFKTDNCTTQYKCLHVFAMYSELATEIGKVIVVYYGPAGHGRGLVDGMSSWGVKTPLRKHIIIADWFWYTSSELVNMFIERGFSSDTRHYTEIAVEEMSGYATVKPRPVQGCTKFHMMAFHPDGSIFTREDLCDCDSCIDGKFSECKVSNAGASVGEENEDEEEVDNNNADDEDDEEGGDDVTFDLLCQIVQPGMIIALRTDPSEPRNQSFYLVAVNEVVREAPGDTFDAFNHYVCKGGKYLSCSYLEIDERATPKNKTYIQYKKCSSKVIVMAGEVLSPFVNITEDLKLRQDEKQFLDDCA